MIQGFLMVDKPSGPTSHDVVSAVRRATGMKKVGHAGTLDPLATGAVVVAINCTRLLRFVQGLPKEYLASVRFGVTTSTLDAEGEVTGTFEMAFDRAALEAVIPEFVGDILQVPPMVSALKHEGRRLHQMAREGIEIEREPRPVTVHSITVEAFEPGPPPQAELRVVCGSGTYVRSLAGDIGRRLRGGAHLQALRRERIGGLAADEGVKMDDLGEWRDFLIEPVVALADLPAVRTDDERAIRTGRPFATEVGDGVLLRVVDDEDQLLAIYRSEGGRARAEVVLT